MSHREGEKHATFNAYYTAEPVENREALHCAIKRCHYCIRTKRFKENHKCPQLQEMKASQKQKNANDSSDIRNYGASLHFV